MIRTRTELLAMLENLERDLPGMIAAHPLEAEFWAEFTGVADVIEDAASANENVYVSWRINSMLAAQRLIPRHDSSQSRR
jgi:hypothetical protein